MKEQIHFLKKYKYILALVMTMLVTTVLANTKENKIYNYEENTTAISDNSDKNNTIINNAIINNLVLVRNNNETYLLFCPEDRGLCVNYETEEFIFMYRSNEDLLSKLKENFGIDVEIEKFKTYLMEKYGDKEEYTYNEIFSIFDSLKNTKKNIIKIK